ncbi:MAG: type IV pilus modification protein PilV [Burkholderiaceae bacterium]|nr:type IV pilus modification protein PilV [Burkholderiaceae bacterium]
MPQRPALPRRQSGISLMEALVALVVMALGVLGVLSTQLRTLVDTQSGIRRAQAVRLVEDLSERIRSNPAGLTRLSDYEITWNTPLSPAAADCAAAPCNSTQLAQYDRMQWLQNVRATLKSGDAAVFMVADDTVPENRRQLGVVIRWRDNERKDAEGKALSEIFAPSATKTTQQTSVSCPTGSTCHLQYLVPTARCTPYTLGGGSNPPLICAQ